MSEWLRIRPADNVAVALRPLSAGECHGVRLLEDIKAGHKFALAPIPAGEPVIKYGSPIGNALLDIAAGAWVHVHNLKTALTGKLNYLYTPVAHAPAEPACGGFMGYPRADGRVGIRNEIWIIPTVGCVGHTAENLAARARERLGVPVYAFSHPYGCSQLGEDHARTQKLLAALARHPNAGGVLVLGLGCENNHIAAFRQVLGPVDSRRFAFLSAQDTGDEIAAGMELIAGLWDVASGDVRVLQPLDKLVLGLKCGGSDGFSGITANPLLGRVSDSVCAAGGSALLTEVPEMFGAETLLMERCVDRGVFDKTVDLINGFKEYYRRHGQPVYENPSPGNKEGGITTLEEKSLGCTQKGGTSPVTDVLAYAEPVKKVGLSLICGPGNDQCSVTALAAAGAQMILFTTGRGTPLGSPVPTLKISTNTGLSERKPAWMDFDAGRLLSGTGISELAAGLLALILRTADGAPARNEEFGYREIAIFKDGVTL
jgi:altronate hydrolase